LDARYSEWFNDYGIKMSVKVGLDAGDFEIYFPQIEDATNQIIRLSENPTTAKKVFEYAKGVAEEAKETPDVNKLYNKVLHYADEAMADEPPPPPVKPIERPLKNVSDHLDFDYKDYISLNGGRMSVEFDDAFNGFVIVLPKDAMNARVIRISMNAVTANKAFKYAVSEAKKTPDFKTLLKKIETYANDVRAAEHNPLPTPKAAEASLDTGF
jgi:hypothetical protein